MIGLHKEEEEWMTRHRGPAAMERSCRDAVRKRQKGEISGERRTRARKKKETRPVSRPQPADATTSFVHDGFQRDNARKRETKSEGGRSKRGKRSAQKNRLWSTDICACEREKEREKKTRTRDRRDGLDPRSNQGSQGTTLTWLQPPRVTGVRPTLVCRPLVRFSRRSTGSHPLCFLTLTIGSRTLAKTSPRGECSRGWRSKRGIYVGPFTCIRYLDHRYDFEMRFLKTVDASLHLRGDFTAVRRACFCARPEVFSRLGASLRCAFTRTILSYTGGFLITVPNKRRCFSPPLPLSPPLSEDSRPGIRDLKYFRRFRAPRKSISRNATTPFSLSSWNLNAPWTLPVATQYYMRFVQFIQKLWRCQWPRPANVFFQIHFFIKDIFTIEIL